MKRSVIVPAPGKRAYNAPEAVLVQVMHENCILSGGTRQELDDLGGSPIWDSED